MSNDIKSFDFSEPEPETFDFTPFKEPSNFRSLISAPVKGFAKQVISAFGTESPGQAVSRLQKGIPSREKEIEEQLTKLLPTKERFAEKALERAGGLLIPFPGLPIGGTLGRAALAGVAGQTAEEFGGGPLVQAGAEAVAFGAPSLGRRLIPSRQHQQLVDFARRQGLSEAEITRAVQSEGKTRFFSRLAAKGPRTQTALRQSREAIGRIYEGIRQSPEATQAIPTGATTEMIENLETTLFDMPRSVRNTILGDFEDLVSQPITGNTVINFWQDINSSFRGNRQQLGRLFEPLREGLRATSPQLAEDFQLTNQLFSNVARLGRSLRPNIMSELLDAGEAGAIVVGVGTGNFSLLKKVAGEVAGRGLAREILINPRFQSITRKMLTALNQNQLGVANSALQALKKEIGKTNPDIAGRLEEFDFSEAGIGKKEEGR